MRKSRKLISLLLAVVLTLSCFACLSSVSAFATEGDTLKGDVDKNGRVEITDVTLIQLYVAKDAGTVAKFENGTYDLAAADVDGNGTIDIMDATFTQLIIAHAEPTTAEPTTEAPTTEPVEPTTEAPTTEAPTTEPATEVSYVVAGSSVKIFGETWKPAETANDMTKGEDGNYSITYKNVEPEDDVQFKVVENHSWDNPAYGKGSGNFTFNVKTACDVTITFNPETKEITVTGEGVEIPEGIKIESMYMTGNVVNVFGEDWHPNAVELKKIEENVYQVVLEDIDADDYQVKFCVNGAWTHNFGDAKGSEGIDLSEEATLALTYNGDNIKFTVNEEGSKLTVTFDCTKMDENGSGAVATFKLEAPVVPVVE